MLAMSLATRARCLQLEGVKERTGYQKLPTDLHSRDTKAFFKDTLTCLLLYTSVLGILSGRSSASSIATVLCDRRRFQVPRHYHPRWEQCLSRSMWSFTPLLTTTVQDLHFVTNTGAEANTCNPNTGGKCRRLEFKANIYLVSDRPA